MNKPEAQPPAHTTKGWTRRQFTKAVAGATVGTIAVPARPSVANRNAQERTFLAWRRKEMPKRRQKYLRKFRGRVRTAP